MSTEYELKERIKQLENEIKNLLEEQNRYLRILNKNRHEELTQDNLSYNNSPVWLSQYIKQISYNNRFSLSNLQDNLSTEQLNHKINRCVELIIKAFS